MGASKSIRAAALEYAARGWKVFPVYAASATTRCTCSMREHCERPGKHPLTDNGLKDASTDAAQIEAWFPEGRPRSIGIAAGASGIVVLDFETAEKGGVLAEEELRARHGTAWCATAAAKTGSGGIHYYFRLPPGRTAKSTTKFAGLEGVDVRGEGGFVVAPPSGHVSGGSYEWLDASELAEAPDWLLEGAVGTRRESLLSRRTDGAGILRIESGSRNNDLCSLMGTLQGMGIMGPNIARALNEDLVYPPLDLSEVDPMAERIMSFPVTRPYQLHAKNPFDNGNPPTAAVAAVDHHGNVTQRHVYTPSRTFTWWVEERGGKYDYKSNTTRFPDGVFDCVQMVERLILDGAEKGRRLEKELHQMAANEWIRAQRTAIIATALEGISGGNPAHAAELAGAAVDALCGPISPELRRAHAAVLLHFIWQVKRKLADLPVDHHMMPILFGPQAAGKSTFVRLLLKPVDNFMYYLYSLSVLNDPREAMLLSRSFVIFADEMARATDTDIGILKNNISGTEVGARVMRTTEHVSRPNVATFIGCSNEHVRDLVRDWTGARRFWQISCQNPVDRTAVNALDFFALWRGVDERAATPLLPELEFIQQIQRDELRGRDTVETFTEGRVEHEPGGGGLLARALYEDYKTDVEFNGGRYFVPFKKFTQRLRELGFSSQKTNAGLKFFVRLRPTVEDRPHLTVASENKNEKT